MEKERASRKKLTIKQEKFCHAYVETGNASEAYRRVYNCKHWKDKSVWEKSSALLANSKVQSRVDELRANMLKRHEITVDKVIRELALIGFANMEDYIQKAEDGTAYVDLSKMTRAQAAAIGEITVDQYVDTQGKDEDGNEKAVIVKKVKFKLADKRSALVDLGRHLGMFPSQVSGKIEHKHDHKHDHEHRPVSESAEWLTGMLGSGSDIPPKKPVLQ